MTVLGLGSSLLVIIIIIIKIIYDAENKGLSYFPSDENKGLKSIAEIRCSVIKSLITDSMASIRLVT